MVLFLGYAAEGSLGFHDRGHGAAVGFGSHGRVGGVMGFACEFVEQSLGHDDGGCDHCWRVVVQIRFEVEFQASLLQAGG